ncbi:hypothetical protein C2845_PM02G18830 [Panicum miliaceum]|uniref:Uncharacterized protein n=1 Tax=Panicum miliaceum TaxID=4540 RepID=A0A3L6S5J3_PANMI|nr:hypothetical protein C2845_PM02G18830 [Panicum miliaceum]
MRTTPARLNQIKENGSNQDFRDKAFPYEDELDYLFGSMDSEDGQLLCVGGVGDRTPSRGSEDNQRSEDNLAWSEDNVGRSTVGHVARRLWREQTVDSPPPKKTKSMESYVERISESMIQRSKNEGSAVRREQEEIKELLKLVEQDGVRNGSELYFIATELFKYPARHTSYKCIDAAGIELNGFNGPGIMSRRSDTSPWSLRISFASAWRVSVKCIHGHMAADPLFYSSRSISFYRGTTDRKRLVEKEFLASRSGSSTLLVGSANSVNWSPPSSTVKILRRGVAIPSRPCAGEAVLIGTARQSHPAPSAKPCHSIVMERVRRVMMTLRPVPSRGREGRIVAVCCHNMGTVTLWREWLTVYDELIPRLVLILRTYFWGPPIGLPVGEVGTCKLEPSRSSRSEPWYGLGLRCSYSWRYRP